MRRIGPLVSCLSAQVRFHASYETVPLTHKEIFTRYKITGGETLNELQLLEQVEDLIGKWKLNRWEMRIPHLLSAHEKEVMQRQQELFKGFCFDNGKRRDAVEADLQLVSTITGISKENVREKNRLWLQEETGKLRWLGEVKKAVDLREAFLRLELCGSMDFMLLERLCCVYGLALQGSFDDAFSNYIVEDPATRRIYIEEKNPFRELINHIVSVYPEIDIVYDFLGFNLVHGYRSSLRRYISHILKKRSGTLDDMEVSNRLVCSGKDKLEILFDVCDSKLSMVSGECAQGLPDFLYVRGTDLTLITVASENLWMRNRQLPHRKQMEGIARRASFVMRIPFSNVRIRNLLLPPRYMDKQSLARLNEVVLGINQEDQKSFAPWLLLYNKELDSSDVDFCEVMKTTNEEEWVTL